MIGFIVSQFAAWGLPEPLRKAAAWATVVLGVLALLLAAKAAYDASVIRDHEDDKAIQSIEARDKAAEQRAVDAITNAAQEKEARDAIQSVDPTDAQRRLDCLRLARIGRIPEPCRRYGGDGKEAGSH